MGWVGYAKGSVDGNIMADRSGSPVPPYVDWKPKFGGPAELKVMPPLLILSGVLLPVLSEFEVVWVSRDPSL